jgi:hypothetical protein
MSFSNPPLWILRQTILHPGGRIAKDRPAWEEPKPEPLPFIVSDKRRKKPVTWWDKELNQVMTLEGNKIVPYKGGEFAVFPRKKEFVGNLPKGEYFQFIGSRVEASSWSLCRACHKHFWSIAARIDHKNGCGRRLQEAYSLLRKDLHRPTGAFLCAVCSQATQKTLWGVPLCEGRCVEMWMFGGDKVGGERITPALSQALLLVKGK